MLVLGRKAGEVLLINETIKVHILDIGNKQVKIGIEAPRDISIFRSELLQNDITAPEPGKTGLPEL